MSCCGNGSGIGQTQRNLEAWVQPRGAGVCNDLNYAMTGSGHPGIKIGAVTKIERAPREPIHRRTGAGEQEQCGWRERPKGTNSITVDFAMCSCGQMDPYEFIKCDLDVYEAEVCCPGANGNFLTGWSRMRIWKNISFETSEYTNNVSFLVDDDGDLITSRKGDFFDLYTVYPLETYEQTGLIATGSIVQDVNYLCGPTPGGGCSCSGECICDRCAESWVGITLLGNVIYQLSERAGVKNVQIPNWPATTIDAKVAGWNGTFYAIANTTTGVQVFTASMSSPSTWTARTEITDYRFYGTICTKSRLISFGDCGAGGSLFDLGKNQSIASSTYCRTIKDDCVIPVGGYRAALVCRNQITTVGGCLGDNNDEKVEALAGRDCEIWAGTNSGTVQVSYDSGETWTPVVITSTETLAKIISIVWSTPNVGYVLAQNDLGEYVLYSTINGGNLWSEDRLEIPANTILTKIVAPCCRNSTLAANRLLLAGSILNRGAIFSAEPVC